MELPTMRYQMNDKICKSERNRISSDGISIAAYLEATKSIVKYIGSYDR